mmetsp:Transcript_25082/g.45360  ORF Transcript_25082/g.45360 Transcript_25082/m.45360 type:complete len:138 (-) Transcript_25082:2438-2851(-)
MLGIPTGRHLHGVCPIVAHTLCSHHRHHRFRPMCAVWYRMLPIHPNPTPLHPTPTSASNHLLGSRQTRQSDRDKEKQSSGHLETTSVGTSFGTSVVPHLTHILQLALFTPFADLPILGKLIEVTCLNGWGAADKGQQ